MMTGWRTRLSARVRPFLKFGVLLPVLLVALVTYTMIMTWLVANDDSRRSDLTYAKAIEELESTLQGIGPDSVARVVRARLAYPNGDSVWADTIAIVADTLTEPTLATGGFLRDQIVRFNDAAIRRALGAGGEHSNNVDPDNLLRVIRTSNGNLQLSDQANTSGLIVRSPSAEREWRSVLTADANSAVALVGHSGSIALLPNGTRGFSSVNGRDCEVRAGPVRSLLYCTAAVGAAVGRFYDLAVEKPLTSPSMRLETYRGRSLWLNGRSTVVRGITVGQGSVGESQAIGPFLLSGVSTGHLAEQQWVNGSRRLAEQRDGTIGFFSRAGRSARWPSGATPLYLSFDASLSDDLDQAARSYFADHSALLDAIAVVIVDLSTGRVHAIAEPSRRSPSDPLISFEPRLMGSVVKPIVAAAILSRNPALANLEVTYAGPIVTQVDGVTLTSPFGNDANGCAQRIGLAAFLRCSSNQYAAEMLVRSLRRNGYDATRDGAAVPRDVLERSDLADGLALAFDVDAFAGRTAGRTVPFWDIDGGPERGIQPAVSDRSLIPYESRPWLVANTETATPVNWLARYAFGGWEHRWTLLGLAQSYARIATSKELDLTFLRDGSPRVAQSMKDSVATAMQKIREALADVGSRGTAAPLNTNMTRALGDQVVVLAKTGTLNEATPDDIAVKALAFAVGQPARAESGAPLRCGMAIVTYFDFDREEIRRMGAASLPGVHVEFATKYLPDVLRRHWKQLSRCSNPDVPQVP